MIRIPTVSVFDASRHNDAPFAEFRNYLRERYPCLHEKAERHRPGPTGLLYRIPGKTHKDPSVLMAHYDVVGAKASEWNFDPFSGEITDGEIRGRGAVDTKCTLCAILECVESALSDGWIPAHDLYLSFSGDEEVEGASVYEQVAFLKEKGIRPFFVLDEGGAVIPEGVPGVSGETAMIGIAEKGVVNVRAILSGTSGHASTPPKHTALGRISKAAVRIERHSFPVQISEAVRLMFSEIGRESGGLKGWAFRHIGLFRPAIGFLSKRLGENVNAMFRTTTAVTMAKGSDSYNTLPDEAELGINLRLLGRDTKESAVKRLEEISKDPAIRFEVVSGSDPSPVSRIDNDAYRLLKDVVKTVYPDVRVLPYQMNGGTDSRIYQTICDSVYKFSPFRMSKEIRETVHGANERIPMDEFVNLLAFYSELTARI